MRDDKNSRAATQTAQRATIEQPPWTERTADEAMQCAALTCATRIERGEPFWTQRGSREAICPDCKAGIDFVASGGPSPND